MGAYILRLPDIRPDDLALVGGKGANLAALTRAGFPVPPGFVVTTAAYANFLDATGLAGSDPAALRERIPEAPVPAEIAADVLAACREIGAPAVAVRSSGTAEDLADASFAGQHDTYLNVRDDDAVLAAVRDCWGSLWTPRAVAYRQRREDGSPVALAVVVQEMVDAQWAGVMFTADPVTGRRDRVVIESVPGLGETLVSGHATGHHHVVDKTAGRLVTAASSLPDEVLGELVKLGREVETTFGRPQDIEWTYADGECSLVQTRPLTALPDEPAPDHDGAPAAGGRDTAPRDGARRDRRRLRGRGRRGGTRRGGRMTFAADHLPQPPYPMDRSLTLRPALGAVLGALRSAGLRTPDVDDVLVEIGDGVVQMVPPRVRPTPRALIGVPLAVPKLAALARTRPADWLERCQTTVVSLAERIEEEDLTALSDRELLDRVDELRHAQGRLVPSRFGCMIPRALLADRVLAALLRTTTGPQRARRLRTDLLSAIPCVTTDANRELGRLAAVIRRSPELSRLYRDAEPGDIPDLLHGFDAGRGLLDEVAGYLRRYGYRQTAAPLAGFAPLRERPEALHGLLGRLVRAERADGGTDADGDEQERLAWARAELAAARGIRTRLARPLVRKLATTVRTGVAVREDSHFSLLMVVAAVVRTLILELGRRLVERGVLDEAADVFYLELEELSDLTADRGREVVARRKAARQAASVGYTMFPAELLRHDSTAQAVRGTPASRGTAVGRVRLVRGEAEFGKLSDGEILVCPYTNPAWTPLFSLAAAVVTDTGGAASHAAIVAREYGIPAVMGTGEATRLLSDGQWVRVDGEGGVVVPADEDIEETGAPAGRMPRIAGTDAGP